LYQTFIDVQLQCFNTKHKITNSVKIQHGYFLRNVDQCALVLTQAEYVVGHLVANVGDEE
jgi:hypothetical protein